jgi:plastocyanin
MDMRRMTVITLLLSLIIAAAMVAGGCGSTTVKKTDSKDIETTDSMDEEITSSPTVTMTDTGFQPTKITVKAGTSVTFKYSGEKELAAVTVIKDKDRAAAEAQNTTMEVTMFAIGQDKPMTFTFDESSKVYLGDDSGPNAQKHPLIVTVK